MTGKSPATRLYGVYFRQCTAILQQRNEGKNAQTKTLAQLHFDGGARGNPGPGGSGWVLTVRPSKHTAWQLVACGGTLTMVTTPPTTTASTQLCDWAWRRHENCSTAKTLTTQSSGTATWCLPNRQDELLVRAEALRESAERVQQLSENFGRISYQHTLRAHNTTADFLANLAMDTKRTARLQKTPEPNLDGHRLRTVKEKLAHDTQEHTRGEPKSAIREAMSASSGKTNYQIDFQQQRHCIAPGHPRP